MHDKDKNGSQVGKEIFYSRHWNYETYKIAKIIKIITTTSQRAQRKSIPSSITKGKNEESGIYMSPLPKILV